MQCPSCGAEIVVGTVFPGATVKCAACSAHVRVPGGDSTPSMPVAASIATAKRPHPCPQCKGELAIREADGKIVSACPLGHGLFVTHATLRELEATEQETPGGERSAVDELDAKPPSLEREVRTRMCPRCGDAMTRRAFALNGSVVVDVCGEHGTWFDAGELRAALAAVPPDGEGAVAADRLAKQSRATLDVALALENAREDELTRRRVEVAEDIVDLFNVAVFGRQLGYRRYRDRW